MKSAQTANTSNIGKTQSNSEIQSLIDMCSKKLDQDPSHKKALLLRASSYIKKNELDKVSLMNKLFSL